jgi:hypothetical protein
MNQFTDKLGFSRYTLCKQDYGSFRMAYSDRNEAPVVEGAMAGLGGGRIGRRSWTRSRSRVKERTPLTNLLSLSNNADTPCTKQPELRS